MRALLLFFFTLLAPTLWATIQGDIILSDTLHPQVQLSWNVDVGKMKDTQLYDMIARFYGAPRNPADYDQLRIDIDLFSRPQGFLLFSIGGLSSSQMPQANGDLKVLSKHLIDLIPSGGGVSSSYPLLGSILTGASPQFHGVHVHNEFTKDIYEVGNFFDAMHRLYGKDIVSGSGSVDGALVLAPHLKNFGQKARAHYWDPRLRNFVSVYGSSKYGIGIRDFAGIMKSLAEAMGSDIDYQEKERLVTIVRPGLSPLTMDLSSSSVEALFAEVLFVVNMATHTPVNFFSFHFDSLTAIANHYGAASDEYVIAVRMIDAAIAKVYKAYQFHHSLEMSIIYCPTAFQSKEVVETIEPILADTIQAIIGKDLFSTISANLPNIYLSDEAKDRADAICNALRSSLDKFAVGVECSVFHKRSILQEPVPLPVPEPLPVPAPAPSSVVPSSPTQASQEEVELVHIVLWLVIAMIAALLQACYHLAVLDGSNEPEFKPKTYEGGLRSKTTKM